MRKQKNDTNRFHRNFIDLFAIVCIEKIIPMLKMSLFMLFMRFQKKRHRIDTVIAMYLNTFCMARANNISESRFVKSILLMNSLHHSYDISLRTIK